MFTFGHIDIAISYSLCQGGPNHTTYSPQSNFLWPAEQFYTIQVLLIMSSGNLL